MTEILSAVSPSVFTWSMLGRRSSAVFLLPRPEKGVWWPTPCRTHPVRVAAVALKLTDLVSISRNAATGRATWRHLSSSPSYWQPTVKTVAVQLEITNTVFTFMLTVQRMWRSLRRSFRRWRTPTHVWLPHCKNPLPTRTTGKNKLLCTEKRMRDTRGGYIKVMFLFNHLYYCEHIEVMLSAL